MRNKLPRTPFSTPFSPSRWMVEARIRGIIAGPQKRPPLLLLVLVFAFCFLSVNLVSCQPSQSAQPSQGETAHLLSLTLADGGEAYFLEEEPRNDQEPLSDTVGVLYCRLAGGEVVELDALDYGPGYPDWENVSLEASDNILGYRGFILHSGPGTFWDSSTLYITNGGLAHIIPWDYAEDTWQEDLDGDGDPELLVSYPTGRLDVYDWESGQLICTRLNDSVRYAIHTVIPEDAWVSLTRHAATDALVAIWQEDGQERERIIDDPTRLYYIARNAAPYPQTDLNRNGIPETIETSVDINAGRHNLTITENGEVIYTKTAWNEEGQREAVFLYRDGEGKDWLLRYSPILDSNVRGQYLYQVFSLDDAEEFSTPYKWLTFDLSFSGGVGGYNDFDPEAIAAYIGEVNALMRNSTLLICSDPNLKAGFDRKGRLEDDLWWIELDYIRDPDKSLLETLREYQAVKEAAVSERPAVPYVPAPGMTQQQAALAAYRAVLEGKATFYSTDIGRNVDMDHIGEVLGLTFAANHLPAVFTLVDLDGDGVQELVLYYVNLGNGGTVELFHWLDGEVLGYYKVGRGFQGPKTDGTYTGTDSAFTGYLLRIKSFDRSGFEEETTAYYEDSLYSGTYILNGQRSTEQKVLALFEQQYAKENVTWYDLNDENIRAVFP